MRDTGASNFPHARPLVSAFDHQYVWPWLVHLFSGYMTCKSAFPRTLARLPGTLDHSAVQLIGDVTEWLGTGLHWVDIHVPKDVPLAHHFSAVSYAPMALADVMDETFVWVDADTILLEGWQELLFLAGPPLGCVTKATVVGKEQQTTRNVAKTVAGSLYFNSGVMIFDAAEWRATGLNSEWPRILNRYEELGFEFVDQCVLNYLLVDRNAHLDPAFNVDTRQARTHMIQPKVLHFMGGAKPWKVASLERRAPLRLIRKPRNESRLYWDVEKALLTAARKESRGLGRRLLECQRASRRANSDLLRSALKKFGPANEMQSPA